LRGQLAVQVDESFGDVCELIFFTLRTHPAMITGR
jgi:hypothetical protein